MHLSKKKRLKRAKATRMKIRELGVSRLTVTRTPKHIYAQVTSAEGDKVLAQASSLDKEIREENSCLLYTSPSPRDKRQSRMPSSA